MSQEPQRLNRRAKPRRCIWIQVLLALVVLNSFAVLFRYFAVPEIEYRKAVRLRQDGQYAAAMKIFTELRTYKTSAAQLDLIYEDLNRNANVGSTVYYGAYEQDNDATNGKERIAWRVLAMEDDKVLLLSEKNLDCIPYNLADTATTWETSTLRTWLNMEFLNAAFNEEEQAAILTSEVKTGDNSIYQTKGGATVHDKLFILSIDEAKRFFDTDQDRVAKNTAYAVNQGALNSPEGNGWWWLRTLGINEHVAANVNYSGTIDEYGNYVYSFGGCVRPALWINKEDL